MDCDVIYVTPRLTNRPKRALTSVCMEVTYKYRFAWSFPSCFGRLCSRVAVTLAWLLHHFPSLKSLDCPLPSFWTILPIDIKSPARSDDVRVMLDWASVRWAFVFFISSSLLFVAFSMRRTLSNPDPQGGVPYQAPLKRVRLGCVRTPSDWDWTQKPRWHEFRQLLVPSGRQTNRPKRALTFMCMEITYKCRFAWSFPSCFGRLCSHVAVTRQCSQLQHRSGNTAFTQDWLFV